MAWIENASTFSGKAIRVFSLFSAKPARVVPLFSRKATRVIRTLLEHPTTSWEVVKLAKRSQVSIGHAYKVTQKLLTQGFLVQEQREVRLREPGTLLDAWAGQYRIDPAAIQSFYTALKEPAAVMALVLLAAILI